jgi:hypothetical protein
MSVVEAKIQAMEGMYRPNLSGDREQTTDQCHLQGSLLLVFVRTGWAGNRLGQPRVSVINMVGDSEIGLEPIRSLENWRSKIFDKQKRRARQAFCVNGRFSLRRRLIWAVEKWKSWFRISTFPRPTINSSFLVFLAFI